MARPSTSPAEVREDSLAARPWLTRAVIGVGAASLFADSGYEMSTALLPGLLVATLGAPAAALGVIEGVCDGLGGAARLVGGPLADDPGRRRRVAVGGYGVTAVLSAGAALATGAWQIAVLRAGAWTARGLRSPASKAIVADVVPVAAYGRAYGFERAMDNLGAVLGPLLAMALAGTLGVRWAIGLSLIPGFMAAGAIFYALKQDHQTRNEPVAAVRSRFRRVLFGPLGRLFGALAMVECGQVAATLLILRATQLLQPEYGPEKATVIALGLYAAHNAVAAVSAYTCGHLADRFNPAHALGAGVAVMGCGYLVFSVAGASPLWLACAFAVAGAGAGCVQTCENAVVAHRAPAPVRGSAFGVLAAVRAAGSLVAGTVAGIVWTTTSSTAAFMLFAAWSVIVVIALRSVPAPDAASAGTEAC